MYVCMYIKRRIEDTIDRENFVVKKVKWDKSFNSVKAESIVCMSTKELC